MTHFVRAVRSSRASRDRALGSLLLGLLDDLFTARGSLDKLGLDALLARVSTVDLLFVDIGDFLVHLLVVSSCFFSRINSQCSGASQFLLDLSLLRVHLTLFFLKTGLSSRQDQRIVLFGLLLDLAEELALTLTGTGKLLGKCLLNFLLLSFFS